MIQRILAGIVTVGACGALPAPGAASNASTAPEMLPFESLAWSNAGDAVRLRTQPSAQIYLEAIDAYRALAVGDQAAAQVHYSRVRAATALSETWPEEADLRSVIGAIRFAGEDAVVSGELPVPCAVLRQHSEAIVEFGSAWLSLRDLRAAEMRWACYPADPDLAESRARLLSLLQQHAPLPDGTMYQSMMVDAVAEVDWAVLQPDSVHLRGEPARIRSELLQGFGPLPEWAKESRDALVQALSASIQRASPSLGEAGARARAAAAVDAMIVRRMSIRPIEDPEAEME